MNDTGSSGEGYGKGYIVIARKWRPTTFDDVVGQDHVTRTLKNAITGGRVAHAYLFTGPRGVGKTTVARVLAKSLNCVEAPTVKPCSKCAACNEIAQGTSMDVMEIDGASNRGIDEIRNLRESVRYAPVGGKKKVYIIDEVHMLTQEAFNALLKTLEEPPPHVVFVFATTQPLKVLQTIISRCQRFDFRRISTVEIAARLKEICKGDGYKCDDGALALISQQAEGSMRDAQSMLEQVLAFSGGTATEADIRPIMGLRGSEILSKIGRAIVAGDEKGVMGLLGEAFDGGVDPADLTSSLIEWVRYLLIASIDPESRELVSLTPEARNDLTAQARELTAEHLLCLLTMITDAENNLKRASHQRYLLEVTILRMTRVKSVAKISDLIRMLEGMERGGTAPDSRPQEKRAPDHKPAGPKAPDRKASDSKPPDQRTSGAKPTDCVPSGETRKPPTVPAGAFPLNLAGVWPELVESLRETKASLASILDLCEPPRQSDGALWLRLPTAFHESQVHKGENLKILTRVIEKLTNTSVVLKTAIVGVQEDKSSHLTDLADRHPIVRALVENLGGRIVDVRRDRQQSSGSEQTS